MSEVTTSRGDAVKNLNIAMVAACPFPANRGTPSRIKGMAQALSQRGHRVAVVTYHFGLDLPVEGIELHRTPSLPYRYFAPGPTFTKLGVLDPLLLFKLVRLLKQEPFDLIHAHHFEGALIAYAARRITGVPAIYDAHTTLASELATYSFPSSDRVSRYLDKNVPHWADQVVTVSETLRDIIRETGVEADKIDVIPTGADLGDFDGSDANLIRDRFDIGNRQIVMYSGSLDSFQQVELLIDAMSSVARQESDAVLFLVVARDRPEIRARCVEAEIQDRVIVAVEEDFRLVPSYLAAADVLVIPRTVCAGIPQKLVNYMLSERAIVSFAGSAKLLQHEVNGLVVENGNTEAMATAIVRLIRDPSLRRQLGEHARETVVGHYDWQSLAVDLEQTYGKVLVNSSRQ